MSDRKGSPYPEIKADWHRYGERTELSPLCQFTAWMVLCKSWVYTHRLPPLGETHNMKHCFPLCMSACMWRFVRGFLCLDIQWCYLSVTLHSRRQHTYNLLSTTLIQRALILQMRCKVAPGIPEKWQVHWLTVTPPQYQFDDTPLQTTHQCHFAKS